MNKLWILHFPFLEEIKTKQNKPNFLACWLYYSLLEECVLLGLFSLGLCVDPPNPPQAAPPPPVSP
jgi:hypothetical protein